MTDKKETVVEVLGRLFEDIAACYPEGTHITKEKLVKVRRFRLMKDNTNLSDDEILKKLIKM